MPSLDNYVIIYHFNLLVEFFLFRTIMGRIAIGRSLDNASAFWIGTVVDDTCRVQWSDELSPIAFAGERESRVH